jgi:hypothetical protein
VLSSGAEHTGNKSKNEIFGDHFYRSVFDDSPGAQILKLFLHVWAVSMTNGHREMVKTILDSVLESPPKHQIA